MNNQDVNTLRSLAAKVREIAERPVMTERKERWRRHNALEQTGPMLLCFPEGAWEEILPPESMTCSEPRLRAWERQLKMKIWWADEAKDDHVIEPWFDLAWRVDIGDFGVPVEKQQGEHRGSFAYVHPLKNLPADLDKLQYRPLHVDREASERDRQQAMEMFGDILPARFRGNYWWTCGLTWAALQLIGMEEMMLAPYEQPENLHRLMAWLRDEQLHFIEWFEKEGLLSDQNEADYVGSGSLGCTDELPLRDRAPGTPARLTDRWGFAESQETMGMSPEMFSEYVLPYQVPLLDRFGLNYYGCCEPLEARWSSVKTIPRLRRVSVSPWAKMDVMAEQLGRDYVYCRKPNPAPICVGFQEDVIRRDLRDTLEQAGDCILEIVLKDTHTIENDPSRLIRWVELAREAVEDRS